jgi:hypothetical protein
MTTIICIISRNERRHREEAPKRLGMTPKRPGEAATSLLGSGSVNTRR